MKNLFWELSDDEILKGMTVMYAARTKQIDSTQPLAVFAYDRRLQRMAEMLRDCNFDRTLMKLQYGQEIADLESEAISASTLKKFNWSIIK